MTAPEPTPVPSPVPRGPRPGVEERFTSRLRSAAVAARVGLWLGVCFGVAFLTGLLSHYAQVPDQPVAFPTVPVWGYRVSQGIHVAAGSAAVPLLLVKLWTVYPRLFEALPRPLTRPSRALLATSLERGSIAVLVASAIFQLASGLVNITQWYPWGFSFRTSHYALAWVAIGALVVHVAVKLPVIRDVLGAPLEASAHDRPTATGPGPVSRRTLLRGTWAAAGAAVLLTAGATVPWLRRVSVLAVRTGEGPQGVPVNRSARAAGVTAAMGGASYRLEVVRGDRVVSLSRADLAGLAQRSRTLPIACVEGWSASGTWTGVPVRALLDLVGAPAGGDVRVVSLQTRRANAVTVLPGNFADSPDALLALSLNGEPLSLDHGSPARIIAPDRPGVLQTKWVTRLEVLA
ncbi:molybdopterin-binding protein [Nocardioides sp. GY 10113]|uniref:molybdopterin-dependent oxidoreductase n=1 Tax=Nocardioides sp. GY 10113 TaxID=2569761 RepID=UPI0010A86079|nr:molybdopterin-dependent oxidoreductase [Nocardioides sp. GY 10113]TIC80656.1 molybdopterin-binding protein [Nocardioides sp. GY 10113]